MTRPIALAFALAASLAAIAAPARADLNMFDKRDFVALRRAEPPISKEEDSISDRIGKLPDDDSAYREYCSPARRRAYRNPRLHLQCGMKLLVTGDFDDAESAFREAARLLPNLPLARRLHANAMLESRKFADAEREARAVLRLAPADPWAHWILGRALLRLGRYAEARAELEIADRLNPTYHHIDLDMGLVLEQLKQYDEARTRLMLFTRLSKIPEPHFEMLSARAALKRLGVAAPGENPAAFDAGAAEDADAAMAALKFRDLGEAERLARRAVAAAPRYWRTHHVLAFVLYRSAGAAAALPHAERAAALEPSNANVQLRLAEMLRETNQLEHAVIFARTATELAPMAPQGYHELALTYYALSRLAQALDAVRRALEIRPDYADSLSLYGHLLNVAGRPAEALPVLERALYADPRNPMPNFNLGLAYAATGKRAEAEYHLKTYLDMTKGDPGDAWRPDAQKVLDELARPARKSRR